LSHFEETTWVPCRSYNHGAESGYDEHGRVTEKSPIIPYPWSRDNG
jgi:hypothetical protein